MSTSLQRDRPRVYKAATDVGTRHFRTGIVSFDGDCSIQDTEQSPVHMDCCLHLQVKKPTSVLRPVVLFVQVPFKLPHTEHDWYLQPPLRTPQRDRDGNVHHLIHRPRIEIPRSEASDSQDASKRHQAHMCPRQHTTQQPPPHVWHLPITVRHHPASRIMQQQRYAMHIKELLRPIEALYKLHADIQI